MKCRVFMSAITLATFGAVVSHADLGKPYCVKHGL